VRELADRIGAVLVFDEISAAWRHHFGGVHLTFGVDPDIAVFAKSISNGFPMAAIIGTERVMEAAQDSFISSAYWTESIGPTAALAALKKMASLDVAAKCIEAGRFLQEKWNELARKHELDITISGFPSLFSILLNAGDQTDIVRTLFTQEMLDRGFLANANCYPSLSHDRSILQEYIAAVDDALSVIRRALSAGDAGARLRGPVAQRGFSRLT
jgi:glutamate-1-semialdehyde aminotransferase